MRTPSFYRRVVASYNAGASGKTIARDTGIALPYVYHCIARGRSLGDITVPRPDGRRYPNDQRTCPKCSKKFHRCNIDRHLRSHARQHPKGK